MSYKTHCPNCHQKFVGDEWHKAIKDGQCEVLRMQGRQRSAAQ